MSDLPVAAMTTSQLIAHLQGLTVGDLGALKAKLDEGAAACHALGHEDVAAVLDEACRSLARGDLQTFGKRVETLIAGGRAQPDLVRSDAEAATVQATFEVDPGGTAGAVLAEAGHASEDGLLVIKRELSRADRNRVFVNDSPATVGLLERLGDVLVELHGQHEHQRLMEPARQLDLLDRFADCEEQARRLSGLVERWVASGAELARLREEASAQARQEEMDRLQLSEIDAARLRDGEDEELRGERRRLQHADRIAARLNYGQTIFLCRSWRRPSLGLWRKREFRTWRGRHCRIQY